MKMLRSVECEAIKKPTTLIFSFTFSYFQIQLYIAICLMAYQCQDHV